MRGFALALLAVLAAASASASPPAAEPSGRLPLILLEVEAGPLRPSLVEHHRARIQIFERQPHGTQTSNALGWEGRAEFHLRGNSSQGHPKKPYKLELQDEQGRERKAALLGMPAGSDWILLPAYTDKTLVRDALAYELWRAMGHYAPRTRYVELFIQGQPGSAWDKDQEHSDDGVRGKGYAYRTVPLTDEQGDWRLFSSSEQDPPRPAAAADAPAKSELADVPEAVESDMRGYQGVYLLIEKVTRGKNRLNLRKLHPDPLEPSGFAGGYIFKKDRVNVDEHGFTSSVGIDFVYEEPKEREIQPEQKEWLIRHVRSIEHALFGPSFRDPDLGYPALMDVDSFIDYHWMVEATKNIDGYWFSQYYHFDQGGKLKIGPIWDWDLSFGNAFYYGGHQTNGWRWETLRGPHYRWFARLFEDPDFLQRYIDRWSELRSSVLATSNVLARVDALVAQIGEAQVRNYQRWRTLGAYVHPNRFIGQSYEEEVAWMKQWITGRLAWIDSQGFPAPKVELAEGRPAGPVKLTLSAETGRVYYTLNGTDPRLRGGVRNPVGVEVTNPLLVSRPFVLTARVLSEHGLWSAPVRVGGVERDAGGQ